MELIIKLPTFAPVNAEIAQLVEHNLAKVRVASSSLVFRSSLKGCSNGGIGRHEGLKIPWPLWLCGFKSRFEYEIKIAIIWMTNGCDFFCVVVPLYKLESSKNKPVIGVNFVNDGLAILKFFVIAVR